MTAAVSTHLIIADDHPLFRDALRQAVASVVTSAKIDEAGSFEDIHQFVVLVTKATRSRNALLSRVNYYGNSGYP